MILQQDIDQALIKEALFHTEIPLMVCCIAPFRILYMNNALEKEWGYYTDIIKEDPYRFTEIIYMEDQADFIDKVVDNSLDYLKESIEFRMVMPDNSQKWYSLKTYPLRIYNWRAGILENITERKCKEIALQAQNDKLEDYIRIIKHDLKSTTGSIEVASHLIKENINAKERKVLASYFDLITMVCHAAVAHTEELYDRFFLTSENILLKKEEIDLAEEIFQAVDLYRAQLEAKKLTIDVLISEGKMIVHADKIKFWQIVKNLLSNAIKFSKEGGTIIIALKNLKDAILLEVSDTGIGIPPTVQPFIFQKNSSAKREGTGGEKPTGMGTYIVKQMVEAHDGEVWFESEEGEGTTFYVKLPK